MDFITMLRRRSYRDTRFRTPLASEKRLGLWVDRIGTIRSEQRPDRMRDLGQYAAVYVEEGHGEYLAGDGAAKRVEAGDTMLVFPGFPCLYRSEGGQWTTWWVVFNGPGARRFEGARFLSRDEPVVANTGALVREAHRKLSPMLGEETPVAVLERHNILCEMVLGLVHVSNATPRRRENAKRIAGVLEYLSRHFAEPFSMSELPVKFAMSYTSLRRTFRAATGSGMKEYVLSLRISKAKTLLLEGSSSIAEVASACGFEDPYYFMRLFKRSTGLPPGRYGRVSRVL